MFMNSSLVKELPVLRQNIELTNKTRQNIAHQHTEAAVGSAILSNTGLICRLIPCVIILLWCLVSRQEACSFVPTVIGSAHVDVHWLTPTCQLIER